MKRCADCRHWGDQHAVDHHDNAVEPDEGDLVNGRIARLQTWESMSPVNKSYRACGAIPMGPVPFSEQTSPGAVVMDGSEYYARLRTQADFGCVLFEAVQGQES